MVALSKLDNDVTISGTVYMPMLNLVIPPDWVPGEMRQDMWFYLKIVQTIDRSDAITKTF